MKMKQHHFFTNFVSFINFINHQYGDKFVLISFLRSISYPKEHQVWKRKNFFYHQQSQGPSMIVVFFLVIKNLFLLLTVNEKERERKKNLKSDDIFKFQKYKFHQTLIKFSNQKYFLFISWSFIHHLHHHEKNHWMCTEFFRRSKSSGMMKSRIYWSTKI